MSRTKWKAESNKSIEANFSWDQRREETFLPLNSSTQVCLWISMAFTRGQYKTSQAIVYTVRWNWASLRLLGCMSLRYSEKERIWQLRSWRLGDYSVTLEHWDCWRRLEDTLLAPVSHSVQETLRSLFSVWYLKSRKEFKCRSSYIYHSWIVSFWSDQTQLIFKNIICKSLISYDYSRISMPEVLFCWFVLFFRFLL